MVLKVLLAFILGPSALGRASDEEVPLLTLFPDWVRSMSGIHHRTDIQSSGQRCEPGSLWTMSAVIARGVILGGKYSIPTAVAPQVWKLAVQLLKLFLWAQPKARDPVRYQCDNPCWDSDTLENSLDLWKTCPQINSYDYSDHYIHTKTRVPKRLTVVSRTWSWSMLKMRLTRRQWIVTPTQALENSKPEMKSGVERQAVTLHGQGIRLRNIPQQ